MDLCPYYDISPYFVREQYKPSIHYGLLYFSESSKSKTRRPRAGSRSKRAGRADNAGHEGEADKAHDALSAAAKPSPRDT